MRIRQAIPTLIFCSLVPAFSTESQLLLLETRERLVATLGKPLNEAQVPDADDIGLFRKDAWEFKVRFEKDRAKRVKVSRLDRGVLSDQEIRRFLPQIHRYASWKVWTGTSRRAWFFYGGKHPTYYCVGSQDGRSLLLVCPTGKDTPPDLSDF
jgi:hypothetical protein